MRYVLLPCLPYLTLINQYKGKGLTLSREGNPRQEQVYPSPNPNEKWLTLVKKGFTLVKKGLTLVKKGLTLVNKGFT